MKPLLILLLTFFTFGCAQTGVVKNPNFQNLNSNDSAQIFIARPAIFLGDGIRFEITIDGWTIAKIYPSQYICILIPTGSRSIGVEGQSSLTLNFLQGGKYFFNTYISGRNFGIVIERMNEKDFYEMVTAKNKEGQSLFKDISANLINE